MGSSKVHLEVREAMDSRVAMTKAAMVAPRVDMVVVVVDKEGMVVVVVVVVAKVVAVVMVAAKEVVEDTTKADVVMIWVLGMASLQVEDLRDLRTAEGIKVLPLFVITKLYVWNLLVLGVFIL